MQRNDKPGASSEKNRSRTDDTRPANADAPAREGKSDHVEDELRKESVIEEVVLVRPLDSEVPPTGLPHEDAERRSALARSLRRSVFPAAGPALHQVAEDESAPGWVLEALSGLPAGQEFGNVQEVWAALGGRVEEGRA